MNGIDTKSVIAWIRESPRRDPAIAFTSGPDRVCADLIRIAESEMQKRLDKELEEAGLEIRAKESGDA